MALFFPPSPPTGTLVTGPGEQVWMWDGTKWVGSPCPGEGGEGTPIQLGWQWSAPKLFLASAIPNGVYQLVGNNFGGNVAWNGDGQGDIRFNLTNNTAQDIIFAWDGSINTVASPGATIIAQQLLGASNVTLARITASANTPLPAGFIEGQGLALFESDGTISIGNWGALLMVTFDMAS